MVESLIVGLTVAAAFAWVVWTILLPAAARDRLRRLAGRPAPPAAKSCCGCCGCGGTGADKPGRPVRHG